MRRKHRGRGDHGSEGGYNESFESERVLGTHTHGLSDRRQLAERSPWRLTFGYYTTVTGEVLQPFVASVASPEARPALVLQ